jgi:hypothetical protein
LKFTGSTIFLESTEKAVLLKQHNELKVQYCRENQKLVPNKIKE